MAFLDSLKQSLFYGYGYNRNKPGYYDGPHTYHNVKGNRLTFYHVPSGKQVWFPAFITQFTETFKSNWNSEPVMGRSDHIKTFTGTSRSIQLTWELPAADPDEAIANLKACGRLAQFLYGSYQDSGNALSMTEAPVVKVRFANLLQDCSGIGSRDEAGVEAIIKSFSFEPVPDAGFYDSGGEFRKPGEMIAPKLMTCLCSMDIIHMHDVAWRLNPDTGAWQFASADGLAEVFPHLPAHIPIMDANAKKEQSAAAKQHKYQESVKNTVDAYIEMRGKGGKLTSAGKKAIRNNIQSWPYTERDQFIFDVDSQFRARAGLEPNPDTARRDAERFEAEYAAKAAKDDFSSQDFTSLGPGRTAMQNFSEETALGRAMAESDIFKPETTNPFAPPVSPAAAEFDWMSNTAYGDPEVAENWAPGPDPGGNPAYTTAEWEEHVNEVDSTSDRWAHTGDRREQWQSQKPPDWYVNGTLWPEDK